MNKGGKILVTGAAGYLGSIISQKLVAAGYKVTGVDNLLFGGDFLSSLKNKKDFDFKKIDIQNEQEIKRIIKGQDAVIHLAGLVGDGVCSENPQQAVNINYLATKNLISIARKSYIKKFLFASTCSVYGFADQLLTEEDEINPVSVYGMTKVLAEQALIKAGGSRFCTTAFRMSTLYGYSPRMRFDLVINSFTAQATFGDKISLYAGYQWRPFIHVSDAADAYLLALETEDNKINEQILNLGDTNQNFQIYQIADMVKKRIPGSKITRNEKIHEPRNYKVNCSKITKILKFKPKMKVNDGILEMHHAISKKNKFKDYQNPKFTSFVKLNGN